MCTTVQLNLNLITRVHSLANITTFLSSVPYSLIFLRVKLLMDCKFYGFLNR